MKKFVALILALLTVICCMTAYAADANDPFNDDPEAIGFVYETDVLPEEETEPEIPAMLKDDDIVCRMYLCATANSLTGHIWLYFKNLTDQELPLGYVTLLPYEEMSVGNLRNSRSDGGGTYYNGEAAMMSSANNVLAHTTWLGKDITLKQLKAVGEKIKSSNSYILLGYNCGDFACKVWNVCGSPVFNLLVPAPTILIMAIKGAQKGNVGDAPLMKRPAPERCFKQIGSGARVASQSSLNQSCVG